MTLKEYIKAQIETLQEFGIWKAEFVVFLDEYGKVVMKPNLTEEILREFEEKFVGPILFKEEFKSFLTSAIDKAYRAGREDSRIPSDKKCCDKCNSRTNGFPIATYSACLNTDCSCHVPQDKKSLREEFLKKYENNATMNLEVCADWWLSKIKTTVEGMKIDEGFNSSWHRENAKGYNEALDDLLSAFKLDK